ncbi:pentapeptide repeat-containing protein, partial [Chlamydiia bacterium]|nr:pentapeptide repeat-containing protein [Chlamydiia bacterium]
VRNSRNDYRLSVSAANAMTILVGAEVNFSGKDLHGVQIPGAILKGGVFNHTNFKGANLTRTNVSYASFDHANLSEVNLTQLSCEEYPMIQFDHAINAIVNTNDSSTVVVALDGQPLQMWNIYTNKAIQTINLQPGPITDMTTSPDGKILFAANDQGVIFVWDLCRNELRCQLVGNETTVYSLMSSPRSHHVISTHRDGTIIVWDYERKCQLHKRNSDSYLFGDISSNGKILVTVGLGNDINVWDVYTMRCIRTIKDHYCDISCISVDPKGTFFVTGGTDECVHVWRIRTGKLVHRLEGHQDDVNDVVITSDGSTVYSADDAGAVIKWDITRGVRLNTYTGFGSVSEILIDRDGRRFITASGEDRFLCIKNMIVSESYNHKKGHLGSVRDLVSTSSGQRIVSTGGDDTICLWQCNQISRCINKWHDEDTDFKFTTITSDGLTVVVSNNNKVEIRDAHTMEVKLVIDEHRTPIVAQMLSDNDQTVISVSRDGSIRYTNIHHAQPRTTFQLPMLRTKSIKIRPIRIFRKTHSKRFIIGIGCQYCAYAINQLKTDLILVFVCQNNVNESINDISTMMRSCIIFPKTLLA